MMLYDDVQTKKNDAKDEKVIDDVMDEFETMLAEVKSRQTTKHDGDEPSTKKKHHRHRSPESKHDRKKSSHKDRKRRRHSSTGSCSSNRSSSASDRSSSPKHHRSSKKSRHHERNRSPPAPEKSKPSSSDKPTAGSIYDGTVMSIMQWGCFVRLDRFRNRTEGLVHISNVSRRVRQRSHRLTFVYS
jgi:hypothetical protein